MPGALTRGKKKPSFSSKFGSVNRQVLPNCSSSVACPIYVMQTEVSLSCSARSGVRSATRWSELRPFPRDQPWLRKCSKVLNSVIQIQSGGEPPKEEHHHYRENVRHGLRLG